MSDWQDISTWAEAAAQRGSYIAFELRNARGQVLQTASGGDPRVAAKIPFGFRGPFTQWRKVEVEPPLPSHKPGEHNA